MQKSYPDTYAIADLPAAYRPESGTAALWRTTKGWVERLFNGETNYLSPDLAEAGYFSSPGGNTSFSVFVPKRANPYTVIEFTFKDNRGDQPLRTVHLAVSISQLNSNPGGGWGYNVATPWGEISRTIVMPDGSQYPIWLGWQNTADGLLLRWRDDHAGQENTYGAVANIIVRSDRPTLEKMTDAQSGNATVETACAIAPKTLLSGVNTAVSLAVANVFSDGADYHAPDSGDTALTDSGYNFVFPARRTKLQSIEFQYNRPNDTHVDRFFLTGEFLRAMADGTLPNPSDGWGYRPNAGVHEIIATIYGGWKFYFQYWFYSDGSIYFSPRTNNHGGTYTNIIARYSSDALHRLTLDEMRDSAGTKLGVLDGKTANEWVAPFIANLDKLAVVEATRTPTIADLDKPWRKWVFYEWDMSNARATVWVWRRSPVSNDLFPPLNAEGHIPADLTPTALPNNEFRVNLPQDVKFTYSPVRSGGGNYLEFPANVLSSVSTTFLDVNKAAIGTGTAQTVAAGSTALGAGAGPAPANAVFVRYSFSFVKGGLLNYDFAI